MLADETDAHLRRFAGEPPLTFFSYCFLALISLRIPWDYGRGFDPQLERGSAEALRLIKEYPAATPTPEQHPYRGYPKR